MSCLSSTYTIPVRRADESACDDVATPSTGKGGKAKKAHKVDKYGRPLEATSTSNELKRYYRMASPSTEAAEKEVEAEGEEEEEEEENSEGSDDEEEDEVDPAEKPFIDRARGEGLAESSDEEGEEVDSDSDSASEGSVTLAPSTLRRRRASPSRSPSIDLSETEAVFPDEDEELGSDEEEEEDVDVTRRLAVVNMDWDHLRATDLYRVLASSLSATAIAPVVPKVSKVITKKFDSKGEEIGPYKPPSRLTLAQGRLFHLKIYPSKFGTERMEREAREGPPTEVFAGGISDSEDEGKMTLKRVKKKKKKVESDSEDDEITARDVLREQIEEGGEDYDGEALRKYQLERLRLVFFRRFLGKVSSLTYQIAFKILLRYRYV